MKRSISKRERERENSKNDVIQLEGLCSQEKPLVNTFLQYKLCHKVS